MEDIVQYGKIPPQSISFEEAVLGALMLESESLHDVIDIIQPDSFYNNSHKIIFSAIISLHDNNEPIDIITVESHLKKQDHLESVGGSYYIAQLTSKVASASHIVFHARKIQETFIQRELIRICSETLTNSYSEAMDIDELLTNHEKNIIKIGSDNIKNEPVHIKDALDTQMKVINSTAEKKKNNEIIGVKTGSSKLDLITGGWQNTDLVILAARPSMGKTAFAVYQSYMIAKYNNPVAFFSLEMSVGQLVNRYLAIETGTSPTIVRNADFDSAEWSKLESGVSRLEKTEMYFDDTAAISLHELSAKTRRMIIKYKIKIVFIDYLQLMTTNKEKGANREQEISTISRGLKALAKDCNIPIIALSQLNRSVESRGGDRRPQLSDLRESGAIEQDADIVGFIHRPEYYGITTDEEGNSTRNIGELLIKKHRNGALATIEYQLNESKTTWLDSSTINEYSQYDTNTDDLDMNEFIEPNKDF